jgi:hypothetical protein
LLYLELIQRSPNLAFVRVELCEDSNPGESDSHTLHDAATVLDTLTALKSSVREKTGAANEPENTPSLLSTTAQSDLSSLVAIRRVHQTNRAASSVKTRTNPQDSASTQTMERTDRQRLCAQMAELIQRAGSGLERDARWKSGTAPGTRTTAEVQDLTGNSANAEVSARERVNAVSRYPYPHSKGPFISHWLIIGQSNTRTTFQCGWNKPFTIPGRWIGWRWHQFGKATSSPGASRDLGNRLL